ncbi:MAG TPA: GFA family protein [Polyangiaceae bacterium]|nr:GFA family protein [Polyangiaceae bacterium]
MKAEGGCLCGSIRYEVEGEPLITATCYCRDCQYAAGGGPGYAASFLREKVRITRGEPVTFESESSAKNRVQRQFCGRCGTPLFSNSSAAPMLLTVKVGSLDDPSEFRSMGSIWLKSAQPYHRPDKEQRCWDTVPTQQEMNEFLAKRLAR